MTRRGVDYEDAVQAYMRHRQTDPRIADRIHAALANAQTVVNVGAGTGSYEPAGCHVVAVEPSPAMRAMRPRHRAPAIDARADSLPLDDNAVDGGVAVLTIHHWEDPLAGLREMRRVVRGPIAVLTFDPVVKRGHWLLTDYLPETAEHDQRLFPAPDDIAHALGGGHVEPVPIPADCRDGFLEAFFSRPEAYLDPDVRRAQSAWKRLPAGVEQRVVSALRTDLESGAWDRRYGELRGMAAHDGGLRLVVSPGTQRAGARCAEAAARDFVARFAEAWRNPEPQAFRAFWHDEGRLLHPTMAEPIGADAVPRHIERLMAAIPDVSLRVLRWAIGDEHLFIEWELTGTLGDAPLAVSGVDRFTLRGERAVEGVAYFDTAPWSGGWSSTGEA
jgi:SAM-dependent methyltransferase